MKKEKSQSGAKAQLAQPSHIRRFHIAFKHCRLPAKQPTKHFLESGRCFFFFSFVNNRQRYQTH